jgi:hypothetical protein
MDHSIAAKYAARPAARFVRPSARVRERRMGLGRSGSFRAPGQRTTDLHGADVAPLARIRASWRTIRPAATRPIRTGRLGPAVTMEWARSGRSGTVRRPGASAAPWRA